jgi:ADP-heptose:LPS heptosyltransferase
MRVLVVIGAGYGNTIFATPLVRALRDLDYWVDILFDGEYPDQGLVFKGRDEVVICANDPSDLPIPTCCYDAVLNTMWAVNNHNNDVQMFTTIQNEREHHEAEFNYDMAVQMGHTGPMPAAFFADIEWTNCEDYIAVSIPIQKSENWARKSYPHWRELLPMLAEHGRVLVVGTAEETALWEGWFDTRVVSDVYELGHIVAKARCFVGTDNGPSHIASVIGCPSVMIYGATGIKKNMPLGPETIVVWSEDCEPCQYTDRWNKCEGPWRCMDIAPDRISAAVKELVSR